MKKKFMKVALFAVLTLTAGASFVGCKDYDDDITELRDSIDQQKTELNGKVAAVETSIASLTAAQTSLTAEIAKAKDEATKAALAAQEAAIATSKAALETVKTELKAAIAANTKDAEELKTKTAAIEASMTVVLGRVQALEAFQTTTTTALEALGQADVALTERIGKIDLELIEQGKRLTAVEAQIVALKEYNTTNDAAINGLIDRLSKLEDGQLTDLMIEQIAAEVTKVTDAKLSVIEAAIFKGVTHVSLTENWNDDRDNLELGLTSAEAVRTWVFGSELSKENQISFTKGDKTTYVKEFLIRVSPTNAVLTPANINLINSKGEDMTGLVEISDIKAFDGLLTRGMSQNGLWTVSVQMNKEYSEEAFKAAIETKDGGQIRYAVSVNTNLDSKTPRTVVSEYKILFDDASEKTAVGSLGFKVDAKNVTEIHNRAQFSETNQVTPKEYVWAAGVQDEPIFDGAKINVAEGDDRQSKTILPVVANRAITVQLDDATVEAATAFYIVLDKKRALSSDDSELTAWNAMESSITGINKMYDVSATKGKAEITFTKDVNDVFGFRVYAVNSNGSLVDPDGRAFYVQVGKGAIDLNIVNTTVVVPANGTSLTAVKSEKVAVSFEGVKGATASTWVATYENDKDATVNLATDAFKLIYLDKDGNEFTPAAATWANVRAIKTQFLFAANRIIDNQPYEGILTLTGANNRVIATLKVTATKVLSQTAPAEFAPKVNQIVNGVYTCYLVPASGFLNTASTTGSMDLKNVFNGLNDTNYEFTFADSKDKVGDDTAVKVTSAEGYTVTINKKFIDNSTKHATAIKYNYGTVKLVWDAATSAYKTAVHTVTAYQDIQTVYACVYNKAVQTWKWADDKKAVVNYNVASTTDLTEAMVLGTNSYNANDFSKKLSELNSKGLKFKEAHLYSDINTPITKDEYFTVDVKSTGIEFTPQSGTTTPADNVASKLVLIYTDMYGHDVEIQLPFTVKVK